MMHLLFWNSWRPVDAWWQRATGILRNGDPQASANRDSVPGGGWINQAQRFQHAFGNATTFEEKKQVIVDYPYIFQANWLYEQAATNNRPLRWGIEARILARQTDHEISQISGCWPGTIEAYQALFFNVRDRIDRRDFIFNSVLGAIATNGIQAREPDLLWKLVGYVGGPHALDAMIGHFPNPLWAQRPEDVSAFFQTTAINLMKKKAAIASLAVPVESSTQLHLIESFVKYVEIERTTDSSGNAHDQIQENLHAMLSSIPFKAIDVAKAKQLPAYDRGAVELRSDELMRAAAGLPVPGLDDLHDARFPEVPSQ
jgi:hypothetical protein